jgi:hypothetical protein
MEEEGLDDAKRLWDKMFESFFDRLRYKTLTIEEAKHIIDEIELLLRCIRGYNHPWNSVIDIVLCAIKTDISTRELLQTCPYDRSTIYRALNRLKAIGFLISVVHDSEEVWTINRDRFPIIFHITRL